MKVILTEDEFIARQGVKDIPALGVRSAIAPGLANRLLERGYLRDGMDGRYLITELGRQAIFNRHCFNNLLAFSIDPLMIIQFDYEEWLNMAGYIKRKSSSRYSHQFEFEITQKGWDWIAYLDAGDG